MDKRHIRNKMTPDILIITGASGEIGSYICEHYLNQNKIVIGCSRSTIHACAHLLRII